jgi:MFS family permease
VYSQLSNIITELFFPPKNPELAEISFWAVYAVGYLARPLGAVIFGHVGDTHGRRLTLLISVLMITLPTLLIGCLPTYAHIGLAAPILMAFLRFVQGVAVGGEVSHPSPAHCFRLAYCLPGCKQQLKHSARFCLCA